MSKNDFFIREPIKNLSIYYRHILANEIKGFGSFSYYFNILTCRCLTVYSFGMAVILA